MKKFAVLLAGCGRMDGSEIQESVLTMLAIAELGCTYQCFSLNLPQQHVTNHLTNQNVTEERNMLIEAARISRGDIKPLDELAVSQYAGLIIPGGNGCAFNLFSLALDGVNFTVVPLVADKCREFTKASKPVGFICIAPVMIPAIYSFPVKLTIGNDEETAAIIRQRGGIHQPTSVSEITVDEQTKIVSTPAYMLATNIAEAYSGIKNLVTSVHQLSN